jgi:hypothetical protein
MGELAGSRRAERWHSRALPNWPLAIIRVPLFCYIRDVHASLKRSRMRGSLLRARN